jgi:hypothetical protein
MLLSEVYDDCPLAALFREHRNRVGLNNPEIYLDLQDTPGVWRCTFPENLPVWLTMPNFNAQNPSELIITFEDPSTTR